VEQQLSAGLREGQIAEFVESDEVEARGVVGEPPLFAGAAEMASARSISLCAAVVSPARAMARPFQRPSYRSLVYAE
jgi:hypothetical protein